MVRARLVTDRVVPVFGGGVWLTGGGAARCARGGTGSDRAGTAPFQVAGTGWLVRRALAGRRAAASRSGTRPSRATGQLTARRGSASRFCIPWDAQAEAGRGDARPRPPPPAPR